MNFSHLKDKELLSSLDKIVLQERALLTQVLHLLREVERRRLYSELGYSSLFDYAVKHLRYSEGKASRRIQAMRLLKELPELETKIATGKLSLSNIAQAQTYFAQVKKAANSKSQLLKLGASSPEVQEMELGLFESNATDEIAEGKGEVMGFDSQNVGSKLIQNKTQPEKVIEQSRSDLREKGMQSLVTPQSNPEFLALSRIDKTRILSNLENKSAREGQKILLQLQPEVPLPKEKQRAVGDSHTEMRFLISPELQVKLNEVRSLLGIKGATMSFAELALAMAELSSVQLKEKKFGKKRVAACQNSFSLPTPTSESKSSVQKISRPPHKQSTNKKSNVCPADQSQLQEKSILSTSQRQPLKESIRAASKKISANSRYISPDIRFQVWMRDGGQCTKCCSQINLNIDHIQPFALGGDHSAENLRLLCFHCNQRAAVKSFGARPLQSHRGD